MGLGLLSVLVAFSLNTSWALDKASSGTPADSLSITPIDGHSLFNDSADQARSSIDMYMFHLSENGSIQHLIQAQQRGVKVRIILDKKTLEGAKAKAIFTQLQQAGISARASSEGFSITHAKAAVFDNSWSLVTSINLTNTDQYTRDFGIKTYDTDVRDEIEKVFAADWDNATNGTINTPDLSVQKLVWSPVNSKNKIISFIQSARSSIELEVENLGDEDVIAALKERAQQQVKVTVIVPACVEGSGLRNLPYMKDLASGGVDARFSMPPYTGSNPYIHAKAIVVDDEQFYVGSENFSMNSLSAARELGMIETNASISSTIHDIIVQDAGLAKSTAELPADFSCAN